MRSIAILGSTGSVGRQALDVVRAHPELFTISALAANVSVDLLAEQATEFRPPLLSVGAPESIEPLRAKLAYRPRIVCGADGLHAAAIESGAQRVLAAMNGMAAWPAVYAAVKAGLDIALANKELVVAAGEPLFAAAAESGARILPVDSEHSAIFQCLEGERRSDVRTVVLTASGGPFWEFSMEEMRQATPAQALRHPTWSMGAKNTIDSATLMNKGLEVIEASRFFDLRADQIEVVVHRSSIAHAFVVFRDGCIKAQLAAPDMRIPIGYALAYPDRLPSAPDDSAARRAIGLNGEQATLTFEPVDEGRFPCLRLAFRALEAGGTYPAVLSSANEVAGRAFLQEKICFTDIATLVENSLDAHEGRAATPDAVAESDVWARGHVRAAILATAH
jgi:1-deoxy-D-xylulose-5-phosphate reductoisomerase